MEEYLHKLITNNLYFFILFVLIIERLKWISRRNIFTAWLFSIIGTFLHELAHYIVALILNGKPKGISIIPRKEGNGYILGTVNCRNITWYNKSLIGLAPLLIFVFIYYMDIYFFTYFQDNLYTQLLYMYLVVMLLSSAIPSSTDFKVAFEGLGTFFVIVTSMLIGFIYYAKVYL